MRFCPHFSMVGFVAVVRSRPFLAGWFSPTFVSRFQTISIESLSMYLSVEIHVTHCNAHVSCGRAEIPSAWQAPWNMNLIGLHRIAISFSSVQFCEKSSPCIVLTSLKALVATSRAPPPFACGWLRVVQVDNDGVLGWLTAHGVGPACPLQPWPTMTLERNRAR